MKKTKYYVVWQWKIPGIYQSWDDCKEQVHGFEWAKYMSFETKEAAEKAYKEDSSQSIGKSKAKEKILSPEEIKKYGIPLEKSISVDGAWNTATGDMEYQGVETDWKKVLFRQWPFADGTNNIAEFLAIVHALAYCKEKKLLLPIYSDSRNALSWVKEKKCKTKLEKTGRNDEIFELIERAENWLEKNTYPNKLLKWETKVWGENPADFGRK